MNFYICLDCRKKYCGWADNLTCESCGGRLMRVSREVFYTNEEIEGLEEIDHQERKNYREIIKNEGGFE